MTPKHLFILLLALFATSLAQSADELPALVENDNQFPPDNHPEADLVHEGSGAGVIDEPLETTTKTSESPPPLIEDVQLTSLLISNEPAKNATEHACPTSCVCNIEGDSNNYVVDCSNGALTELPKPLDAKTTVLNLQNNKLTEIPKDISELKNLQILNVNNNEIMDIIAGSISELPELKSLKLGNNRLIEYPTDLKNSFGLTKLEELDLGGNDMRTDLKTETFSNFKSLQKLTLPTAATGLVDEVCSALKDTLATVCIGECNTKSFECPDVLHPIDDDLLVALPGTIALETTADDNSDPSVSTAPEVKPQNETPEIVQTPSVPSAESTNNDSVVSFRATVMQAPDVEAKPASDVEAKSAEPEANPTEPEANPTKTDEKPAETESKATEEAGTPNSEVPVKTESEVVGATTSSTKTGGVDKSVIGIIVAGMVVVVAGITIKKNWSSIRKRFSSSPRNANERTGVSSNGTSPEEVPLQEKSPV